tara:strand:- start:874 stop:1365 length:492 start_codon:yes stop_codon:yes gene_type:complete
VLDKYKRTPITDRRELLTQITFAAAMLAIFAAGPAFQAPGSLAGQSRREVISKVATGAAFAAASVAQGASAKAGQFGKQELFGFASAPPPERSPLPAPCRSTAKGHPASARPPFLTRPSTGPLCVGGGGAASKTPSPPSNRRRASCTVPLPALGVVCTHDDDL